MDEKKEMKKMLEGIELEIAQLEEQEEKPSDYENRIAELRKEAEKLRDEVNKLEKKKT